MLRHAAGDTQSSAESVCATSGLDLHKLGLAVWLRGGRAPARCASAARSQAVHHSADFHRTRDEVIHFYRTGHFNVAHPVQAAADGAAALGAVGRAAENAGFDARFEIGRIICGQFREDAIVRIRRRLQKRLRDTLVK